MRRVQHQRSPTWRGLLMAGLSMSGAASLALAQTPVFLDPPGSPDLPPSRLGGPDDPRLAVTHYARFNVLGIARQPGLLSLEVPGRAPALLTSQHFEPREGFDFLQSLPGSGADDLSYSWRGHALGVPPAEWGRLELYVTLGSLLGTLEDAYGVYNLGGRWDEARLQRFDSRLYAEVPYPPFEVREADVRPALELLPGDGSQAPGEPFFIRVSVRNHGPDASEGGVFIFDPVPLVGRLWIRPHLPLVREWFAHCHSLQFDVPGFPGEHVQRVTFGPLDPGEAAHCDLPATVLSAAGGTIPLAGRWFPFPGTDVLNDPVPGNEEASAGVVVLPLTPRSIPAASQATRALLVLLVLLAAAACLRLRR